MKIVCSSSSARYVLKKKRRRKNDCKESIAHYVRSYWVLGALLRCCATVVSTTEPWLSLQGSVLTEGKSFLMCLVSKVVVSYTDKCQEEDNMVN